MTPPDGIARPIVVLGSARSGTSLTAGLLASQGVWTGPCRPADRKNPRGYYENHGLYKHCGESPADPADVARTLEQQGYPGGPWLVKHGPGGWAGWLTLEPVFVLVRRDLEPTVASQLRWQPPSKTEAQRRGLIAHQQNELDCIRDEYGGVDVWPQEIVQGDWNAFTELCQAVGLGEPDLTAAQPVVEPQLWNREYAKREH